VPSLKPHCGRCVGHRARAGLLGDLWLWPLLLQVYEDEQRYEDVWEGHLLLAVRMVSSFNFLPSDDTPVRTPEGGVMFAGVVLISSAVHHLLLYYRGRQNPATWAGGMGNSWRTTDDIADNWGRCCMFHSKSPLPWIAAETN
jgi:hypothetical protein